MNRCSFFFLSLSLSVLHANNSRKFARLSNSMIMVHFTLVHMKSFNPIDLCVHCFCVRLLWAMQLCRTNPSDIIIQKGELDGLIEQRPNSPEW